MKKTDLVFVSLTSILLCIFSIFYSCTSDTGMTIVTPDNCVPSFHPLSLDSSKVKIFVLAGQSNMVGHGHIDSLPNKYKEFEDVHIFHAMSTTPDYQQAGESVWEILKPGHGHLFEHYNGVSITSDFFGPELGLGRSLANRYPNDKICLIKYARSGSSMRNGISNTGSWLNENNTVDSTQASILIKTIKNALESLSGYLNMESLDFTSIGFIWLQGEADASHEEITAFEYKERFETFHKALSEEFSSFTLNSVIVPITDSKYDSIDGLFLDYSPLVVKSHCELSKNEDFCFVNLDFKIGFVDAWHYNSTSYLQVGESIANCFE